MANNQHRPGGRSRDAGRHRGEDGRDRRDRRPGSNQKQPSGAITDLCTRVVFATGTGGALDPALFDEIARDAAKIVSEEGKNLNKSSQLRKFFDELLMWEERVHGNGPEGAEDGLRKYLPLIRMLNAKAAYAQGRNHIGPDFVHLLRRCLEQIEDKPETLRHARLFFEAFMGFYKIHSTD